MRFEPFDVSDDATLLVLTLGVCFSFLAMALEGAVGGSVHQLIEMGPTLFAVGLALVFNARPSEAVGESTDDYPASNQ